MALRPNRAIAIAGFVSALIDHICFIVEPFKKSLLSYQSADTNPSMLRLYLTAPAERKIYFQKSLITKNPDKIGVKRTLLER